MTQPVPAPHTNRTLWLLAAALLGGMAVLRFWLAGTLELFGDEAFYWLESHHPDWGYSDVPLLTPLLVALGTALAGDTLLGVRLLFAACGSVLPLAVWWLALPLAGPRQALWSLLATTAVPLLAGLGVLALPDAPLVLLSTLALGMAVRTVRAPSLRHWLLLGVLLGLGFLAHYRFVLVPLALLISSLSDPATRRLWRTPGPWLAALLALLGLLPALGFNLAHHYAAIGFHFNDRHPWQFQPQGLGYVLLQALVTSPLLYLALLASLWPLGQAARRDPAVRLLLLTSLLYLGVFALLAPWSDQRSTSIHWSLGGYVPLLVFLPVACARLAQGLGNRPARALAAAVLASGWLAVAAGLGWCLAMTRLEQLPYPLARHITANMAGWQHISQHAARFGDAPLLTDNYYLAAQLAFGLQRTHGTYTLDDDKARRDGRAAQLDLWGWRLLDDQAAWPANGVAVLEATRHTPTEWQALRTRLCTRYPGLRTLHGIEQFHGKRHLVLLDLQSQGNANDVFCDTALRGWIDRMPEADSVVSGRVRFDGWYSHPSGTECVTLRVNGQPVLDTVPELDRLDVLAYLGPDADPYLPEVGFALEWDSRTVADGWHRLALDVLTGNGHTQQPLTLWVEVRNADH